MPYLQENLGLEEFLNVGLTEFLKNKNGYSLQFHKEQPFIILSKYPSPNAEYLIYSPNTECAISSARFSNAALSTVADFTVKISPI